MKQNSTSNNLLLLAYNELNSFDSAQLKTAMEFDEDLREEFEGIENIQHHLDADVKKPHTSSIDIILRYSRNSNKERSEELVTY